MTSSDSEGQPRRRKRSRTTNIANSDDGSHKKARGRPRVETQDASSADRRRTQIRLAQRAYRQRKETTISSLKKQNTQLQSIIKDMNQSFLRFNDSALRSGILGSTGLAQELKAVTETFARLAQTAALEGSSKADDQPADGEFDPATEWHNATKAVRTQNKAHNDQNASPPFVYEPDIRWEHSIGFTNSSVIQHTSTPTPRLSHTAGYEGSIHFSATSNFPREIWGNNTFVPARPETSTVCQFRDQSSTNKKHVTDSQPLPFGLVDIQIPEQFPYQLLPQTCAVNLPSPNPTPPPTRLPTPPEPNLTLVSNKALPPPFTYSFQESTFARRITRASLEGGFHLLSSASIRPAAIKHVFRLSMPFRTVEQLREKFRLLLSRGTHEALDSLNTPFLHLGGAGTHYPKRDAQGNIIPIPNSWTVRSIGPHKTILLESSTDSARFMNLPVDLTGFEGEWFDAQDVQGYLESEKGLFVNPRDTFAECEVEVEENEDGVEDSLSFSRSAGVDLTFPDQRPVLSNASSSSGSLSSNSTTATRIASSQSYAILPHSAQGVDMETGVFSEFKEFAEMDAALMFEQQPLDLDLGVGLNANMNSALNSNHVGDMGSITQQMSNRMRRKRKRPVLIDVSKLTDGIVKNAVCLGRCPGFRRSDVDLAFRAAIIQIH
ncbi:hypothetical protein GQ43DRAFT_477454 [Delitschia confertaspora ATCC 74209]|uniref:BZIP domain-containing protein n=1 Tax=Delitschia confertaspora ATCC 74209 TaxID=1513339 RepID=A0A9P4JTJ3_9PLEO|nr:hypothetical protein GQ43DRAFT_477454 [Delitschia confertaspora ATCC 74209]